MFLTTNRHWNSRLIVQVGRCVLIQSKSSSGFGNKYSRPLLRSLKALDVPSENSNCLKRKFLVLEYTVRGKYFAFNPQRCIFKSAL